MSETTRRPWWSKFFKEELPLAGLTRCIEFQSFAEKGGLLIEVWEEGVSARSGVRMASLTEDQRMELLDLLTHGKESGPPADPSRKKAYPPLRMPKEEPIQHERP